MDIPAGWSEIPGNICGFGNPPGIFDRTKLWSHTAVDYVHFSCVLCTGTRQQTDFWSTKSDGHISPQTSARDLAGIGVNTGGDIAGDDLSGRRDGKAVFGKVGGHIEGAGKTGAEDSVDDDVGFRVYRGGEGTTGCTKRGACFGVEISSLSGNGNRGDRYAACS